MGSRQGAQEEGRVRVRMRRGATRWRLPEERGGQTGASDKLFFFDKQHSRRTRAPLRLFRAMDDFAAFDAPAAEPAQEVRPRRTKRARAAHVRGRSGVSLRGRFPRSWLAPWLAWNPTR